MSTGALTVAFVVIALLLIGLAVAVYLLYREIVRLRFDAPTASAVAEALRDGRDEEAVRELLAYLEAAHERMEKLAQHTRALDESIEGLRRRSRTHMQRLGVVRFDASDDVSGGLSRALCVLDEEGNGFLVTTLYDLERSRTFVRAVNGGKTDRELLEPEREALKEAARGGEDAGSDA